MRILKSDPSVLIQPARETGEGECLCFAMNILTSVLKGSARSVKRLLAGPKLLGHSDGWNAWYCHCAAGHAAAPINHLEAVTVRNRIALRLVDFNQYIFLRLGSYCSSGVDF